MSAEPALPAHLLHAVTERAGRIALVLGAGCSLEPPTGLKLASVYSRDVHRQLLEDGLLDEGECEAPGDLSAVTSTVWGKLGDQRAVVERLPRSAFRHAQPNDGYLTAAALLRERAVGAVLTLNFDLAMSAALGRVSATEIGVVPGPAYSGELGSAYVVYLHRNVDEPDAERWILRIEALEDEWRDSWEEVVAQRVMSSPVVVFAGLGSPAAVLTETVTRVRDAVSEAHQAYVVDPAAETAFQAALRLPPAAHVRLGWCAFMAALASRLVAEFRSTLATACSTTCSEHGWIDEEPFTADLCERLHSIGLVDLGRLRASWLLDASQYVPDDFRRALVADLLLGVGIVERHCGGEAHFSGSGAVRVVRDGALSPSFLAASGQGTLRWNAMEARVLKSLGNYRGIDRPRAALLSGVLGGRPTSVAAPEDLLGDWAGDIAQGDPRPELVILDEVRHDPTQSRRLVA